MGVRLKRGRLTSLWCPCYGDDARRPASISVGVMNTLIPIFGCQKDSGVFPEPNKFERRLEKSGANGAQAHTLSDQMKSSCVRWRKRKCPGTEGSQRGLWPEYPRTVHSVLTVKQSKLPRQTRLPSYFRNAIWVKGFDGNVVDVPAGIKHYLETPMN